MARQNPKSLKLIHKTTRYYLVYAFFVFALGSILFYFVTRIILLDSIDEALHQEKVQLIQNLNYEKLIDELKPSENIDIKLTKKNNGKYEDKFTIVPVYDSVQKEYIDHRQLYSIYEYNGNFYELTVRQSMDEAEALLQGIVPAEIGLFALFLVGVLLMNGFISRRVWKPFYELLDKLKDYDLERTKTLQYTHSDIEEFNQLSQSVERMTHRIYRHFINQKEFNENSSHELQTPLAIIRNKLELLIQSKNLQEQEMELIQSMFDAIKRLTLLNKGLILISQIENRQFTQKEQVNLDVVLKNHLDNFQSQMQEKNISLKVSEMGSVVIPSNPILMDILVSNLISNAIKHNIQDGQLKVRLTSSYLKIENTGKEPRYNTENMFERFKKDSDAPQSIGLGLAIVKKIVDLLEYQITYRYENKWHVIIVYFN